MTNRISSNSPALQTSQTTSLSDIDTVAPKTPTAPTTPTTTSASPFYEDKFVTDKTDTTCKPEVKPTPFEQQKAVYEESKAVWELSNQPSISAAPSNTKNTTATANINTHSASPQELAQLATTPVVKELTNAIQNGHSPPNLSKMPTPKLVEALENPDALRSILINAPGGSAAKADRFISDLKDTVLKQVGNIMYSQVSSKAQDSQRLIRPLIKEPLVRKDFLTESVKQSGGDPRILQTILQSSGISAKSAIEIASKLTPTQNESISPKNYQIAGDLLKKAFVQLDTQLGNLSGRMVSNFNKSNRFLTDKTFELVKDNVLSGLNAICTPPDKANTLGKIINEGTAKSRKADTKQDLQVLAIMTTVTIATGGIGGVGIGIGMSAMASAPEILMKSADADQAQLAANQKFGTQENAQDARNERNSSIGTALARTAMGAGIATGALKFANTEVFKSANTLTQTIVENAGTLAGLRDGTADLGEILYNPN